MTPARWLVIFAKEPKAGRVKTRLARGIGTTPATWWFRHQVHRLVRQVGKDPRWRTVLAVAPDIALPTRMLPARTTRIAQGSGDLGDRMGRVLRAMPPGPVVIIGGDIPGITPQHIWDAFAAIGSKDAVLGPAPDGGYWLIGLRRGARSVPPRLFKDIRWSTEHALSDTERNLADLYVAKAAVLPDVDEAGDLDPADIRAAPMWLRC